MESCLKWPCISLITWHGNFIVFGVFQLCHGLYNEPSILCCIVYITATCIPRPKECTRCFPFVYYSYATAYTMYPVFSLVLDKDVSAETAMTYPELYKELVKVNRHQATLHKTHQIPYNAWKVYEMLNDCTLHRQSIQAKKWRSV